MRTTKAAVVWSQLKGLVCVYKPADMKVSQVRKLIINNICSELNEMDCRPPIGHVSVEPNTETNELEVMVQPSLADHPLVVGPRYQFNDLPCSWSNYLGTNTSGVLLMGLRRGTKLSKLIRENFSTRAYRIQGRLGQATENFYKDGKVVERSTFRHVFAHHMEMLLANMQAVHQKKMFELSGVDMQSQVAYELASQGLIRPANSKLPVIYGIKCTEFNPPDFTIEIQCINEYETYLKTLIHEIGMKLHSTAHCTGIQCIRHSHFTLDNTLLKKHWELQHLVSNLVECAAILEQHKGILRQESVALQ